MQDESTEIMPLEDTATLAPDAVSTPPTPLQPQEEVVSTLERETSSMLWL